MTTDELKTACSLLDTQYSYIKNETVCDLKLQRAYYDGMKTIIEDILLGTDLCLTRDGNGKHIIEEITNIPF